MFYAVHIPCVAVHLGAELERLRHCADSIIIFSFQLISSPAESDVRAVVEKYFALYASKDLDGLMNLWSAKIPDSAGKRKALEKQFAALDVKINDLAISRVKIEGERATLCVTLKMTLTIKQNQRTAQQQTDHFQLVHEAGGWKLWEFTQAVDDLAQALKHAMSEEEQERLLAQEPDLLDDSLLAALEHITGAPA